MRLTLGSHSYDLTTRALVVGVIGAPDEVVEPGAPGPAPVGAEVSDEAGMERALAAGALLLCLQHPTPALLDRCASAGVAVVVPASANAQAQAAGIPPERLVLGPLLLDVTGEPCPVAATAAGVIRGARIVRAEDVRGARRVCDVLAAVLEAT